MTITAALYQYLAAHAGLTALVGTRIFPVQAEQGTTFPCLVLSQIGEDRQHAHDGFTGFTVSQVQISVYAGSYEAAVAVAVQVTAAMEAWEGATGIQAVFPRGQRDDLAPERDDVYHIPMEFEVQHGL
jgi:hypothetical protein